MTDTGINKSQQQALLEEEASGFDAREWVFKILHYWYLFVISVSVALSAAYLQNRKWIAQYFSSATVIIKDNGNVYGNNSALMNGFGVDAGYKNVNNQVIMLSSYDLIGRVVDSLPFMRVEYMTKGHFKTRNQYRMTPVLIDPSRVSPAAYGPLFALDIADDGTLTITSATEEFQEDLKIKSEFGKPIENELFSIAVFPSGNLRTGRIYFRFRDREGLIGEFLGRLRKEFVDDGSTVLRISLVSETPARDCEFIDKLCEIFLQQNLERKNSVADNSIRFINEQLELLRQSLQVSEGAMTDFRQENKFVDVSSYAGTLMSRMNQYDSESMNIRLKETYIDYLEKYLTSNMEKESVVMPSSLGLNESTLMTLVSQLNELVLQRGELSEKNVYYQKYTNDINNVKNAIREVISSMRASILIEKKELAERSRTVEHAIQRLPEKELQMVAIERNYRIDDNYYTFFLQKRAEAEIQKASNVPDNEVLDHARTTAMVNSNAKSRKYSNYFLIGLLAPLIFIILSELLNTKIRTPKEAEKLSDFHLIGSIRHARNQSPTLVKDRPRSSYAEMLRSIRTRIEFIVQRKTSISIAVTSTESGDGKTFLCTNLACLYSLSGKRVILVDLDIRKPNVHEKLGLETGPGLTNYLIGECAFEDTIRSNSNLGFDVLLAGTVPPNPGELIHSEKLAEVIETLKQRYDFVIVDTSPIGLVPDAYAIIEQTDLTLFVIRCMQTNKKFCKSALEQLSIDHRDKIHLILSDVPIEGLRYGYYSGGYGYGYGGYGYGYGYGYGHAYGRGRKAYGYGRYIYPFFRRKDNDNYHYYSDEDV